MRNILITGGAGFIGSNFVLYWCSQHPQDRVVVLDALTYAGNRSNLVALDGKDEFTFVHGDICDRDLVAKLLHDHAIDTVVHFAAESHVDRSIHGPEAFIQTNIIGTHTLLAAAKAYWMDGDAIKPHRFHHVSTDEVYGTLLADEPAFSETTPYAPNSPYAASKASSDHLVRAYHHTYGLQVTTSNCSNNYGPFQFPEKLIPLFIINALHGKALPIYGDGRQIRDWLHVEDHCRGIGLIIEKGRVGEVYNIGGNCERVNLTIIDALCGELDAIFKIDPRHAERFSDAPAARGEPTASLKTFVKDRAGHDQRYAVDTTKIESELGYKPVHTFETGFANTLEWYLNNESWWQAVLDGSYRAWVEKHYGAA